MRVAVSLSAALFVGILSNGCGPRCSLVKSPVSQELAFIDASGAPLEPLEVRDNDDQVYRCGDPNIDGIGVTCFDNVIRYGMLSQAAHEIRAVAKTGEVFEGEITPAYAQQAAPLQDECATPPLRRLTITLR